MIKTLKQVIGLIRIMFFGTIFVYLATFYSGNPIVLFICFIGWMIYGTVELVYDKAWVNKDE